MNPAAPSGLDKARSESKETSQSRVGISSGGAQLRPEAAREPFSGILPSSAPARDLSRLRDSGESSPSSSRFRDDPVRDAQPHVRALIQDLITHYHTELDVRSSWRDRRLEYEKELADTVDSLPATKAGQAKSKKGKRRDRLEELGKRYDSHSEKLDRLAETGLELLGSMLKSFGVASEPSEQYGGESEYENSTEPGIIVLGKSRLEVQRDQCQFDLKQARDKLDQVDRDLQLKKKRQLQRQRLEMPPEEGEQAEVITLEAEKTELSWSIEALQHHIRRLDEMSEPADEQVGGLTDARPP